jgi:hypothetical protein
VEKEAQISADKERKFFHGEFALSARMFTDKLDQRAVWNAPSRLRTALAAICLERFLIYIYKLEFNSVVCLVLPEKAV